MLPSARTGVALNASVWNPKSLPKGSAKQAALSPKIAGGAEGTGNAEVKVLC